MTVTAAEPIVGGFILQSLPALRELHPTLSIEVLSDYRILSHTRREVDIALRSAHPEEDGLLARRIATIGFGLYASAAYLERAGMPAGIDDLAKHALIDWRDFYPKAPPAVWFRQLAAQSEPVLKVNGSRDRALAAQLGLGIALLPYITAKSVGVRRVLPGLAIPTLELWLMAHPETARIPRVRAVMDFLAKRADQEKQRFETAPETSFTAGTPAHE